MRKIMLLLVALAIPLAACGDDDGEGSAGGDGSPVELEGTVNDEGTAEAADGDTLEMEVDDFYFGPTFVQATPGATLTLTLTNEGEAPHTFTSDALGVDEELQPGGSTEVEVTLPDSGATLYYCRFHQGQGMQGAFFFEAGDAVRSGISGVSVPPETTGGYGY